MQYDFHKTVQDPNHGEFQHIHFLEHHPELLVKIKRKANNKTNELIKKYEKSDSAEPTLESVKALSAISVLNSIGGSSAKLTSFNKEKANMNDSGMCTTLE